MMRERAEAVGAVLVITSQPGHGTEIAIHWKAEVGR
jgi:signal transduction histidine kinase